MSKQKKTLAESVKEQAKVNAQERIKMTEEEQKEIQEAFKVAKQPIEFTDNDMKLGVQEIDIRKLSKQNMAQMLFRLECQSVTLQRQVAMILVDISRILTLMLVKTTDVNAETFNKELGDLILKLENISRAEIERQQEANKKVA